MTIPVIKGTKGLWSARCAARVRISRYVHVLSLFSGFNGSGASLNWTTFDFKEEFGELKRAGLVVAYIAVVIGHIMST